MTDWYRVLVTGSRQWTDFDVIDLALDNRLAEHRRLTIVHGDCFTGADAMARKWAELHIRAGMRINEAWVRHEAYPALWDDFDRSAGPIRNRYMVELGADECLAFPTASSRGTIGCMKLAQAAGIPVINLGIPVDGF